MKTSSRITGSTLAPGPQAKLRPPSMGRLSFEMRTAVMRVSDQSVFVVPEPVDILSDSLFECPTRPIAELAFGGGDVPWTLAVEMPESPTDIDARRRDDLANDRGGLIQAPIAATGDVEDVALRLCHFGGPNCRLHHIVDVDELQAVIAATGHDEGVAAQNRFDDVAQDLRHLVAGPVDLADAQRDDAHAVEVVVDPAEMLRRHLGHAIGRGRHQGRILLHRALDMAID